MRGHGSRLTAMLTTVMVAVAPVPAGAEELTPLQQQQADRASLASIAESNAKIAASNAATTKAVIEPLASLAGTGKRELADSPGRIEVALLGSTALAALADGIATDVKRFGKLVVLSDDEALNLAAGWQFDEEVAQIKRRFTRARIAASEACSAPRADAHAVAPLAIPALFAAVGALGSLLQSDVKVTGIAYSPKSRVVAALVARELGNNAIAPNGISSPGHGAVDATLAELDAAEGEAVDATAECSQTADAKRKPTQNAVLADVAATGAALTSFRTRLFSADAGGRFPLLDVLIAKALAGHKVLRVRIEDAGGSVVTTKNLLTAFGAPALSVTGGIVASYTVTDPTSGVVSGSALYGCRSQARMLHSVHRNAVPASVCSRVGSVPAA